MPTDKTPSTDLRPARGYSWPDATPGNLIALKHGAYSPRKVGERAEVVRAELLDQRPDLAGDPEVGLLVASFCQSTARVELCHEAIENGNLSPRLVEAASTATRVARELGDALGIGPRAAAELREVRSRVALNASQLAREAPAVLEALERTLDLLGLADRADLFRSTFAAQLTEAAGDD